MRVDLLRSRWKNVRLLAVGASDNVGHPSAESIEARMHLHRITGGYLVQERDVLPLDETQWKVVSRRQPTDKEFADLRTAWLACKHVKSNAIVIAAGGMMLGSGAGQQDRVNACRIAIQKAGERGAGRWRRAMRFSRFPMGRNYCWMRG